ncbi:large conductance mechanosensitive channel protein MscL [Demequina capsici]|uniref:Large-conductance mechanosensitive channel n=1 Tax=Demequina capsici TaxID=3075620 RepID=A0AA96F985_9MICO|nr:MULTISPECIES: large conductance mechanosensitive channel protein MscL [unclassified Demequina]WNM25030.1 large conductance mechanosensitive channel protein MscL [Demequina sp. OYTSA14]WNM27936.1 large conductance mechanosensitive channel protein MscL [Demequina sp. PMTSA13]
MIKGFKDFIMRGNVVDLAVAVVIGTAFTAVVGAIVAGIITPIVAAIFGQPDLTAVGNFTINGAQFSIGLVLDALFKFVTIAAAVYFMVVAPLNSLAARRKKDEPAVDEPVSPTEIELLTEIRDALRKG